MAGPWSLERLAAVSGEPEDRLGRYADAGLLHRRDDDELEPDSLHRLRLIQFARAGLVGGGIDLDSHSLADNQRLRDQVVAPPIRNAVLAMRFPAGWSSL